MPLECGILKLQYSSSLIFADEFFGRLGFLKESSNCGKHSLIHCIFPLRYATLQNFQPEEKEFSITVKFQNFYISLNVPETDAYYLFRKKIHKWRHVLLFVNSLQAYSYFALSQFLLPFCD